MSMLPTVGARMRVTVSMAALVFVASGCTPPHAGIAALGDSPEFASCVGNQLDLDDLPGQRDRLRYAFADLAVLDCVSLQGEDVLDAVLADLWDPIDWSDDDSDTGDLPLDDARDVH